MLAIILLLSLLLQLAYSILILIYYAGWNKVERFEPRPVISPLKVTVIVVARNEEGHIENCLNALLNQSYPENYYEIVLVDDRSEDRTFELACGIIDDRLTVYRLEELLEGERIPIATKKKAIERVIARSESKLIATTDADCIVPNTWLETLVSYYQQTQAKLITGPIVLASGDGMLSKWQELDVLGMMAVTAGSIGSGTPSMSNGGNMCYERMVFGKVGGYEGVDGMATGDDQLLMHKVAKVYPGKVSFLKSPLAIVKTSSEDSFLQLWHQRLRWVSKSRGFTNWKVLGTLVLAYLYNLLLLVILVLGLSFNFKFLLLFFLLFVNKLWIEIPLLRLASTFSGQRGLLIWLPVVQFLHIIYVVVIAPASFLLAHNWKGRQHS